MNKLIQQGIPCHISYDKNGEDIYRCVLPTRVPAALVTTIDMTGLSDDEKQTLINTYSEYTEYVNQRRALIANFEQWIEMSQRSTPPIKWRAYKVSGIKRVD